MKKLGVEAQVPEKKDATGKVTQKAVGPYTIQVDYVDVDGGEVALKEAVAAFGIKPLLSNAFANWRVTIQSAMRTGMKAGMDQAALQAKLGTAKMGVAQAKTAVDPQQAYLAMFASATPDQQKKMIAELTAKAQAAAKK